jgi:hypothetical protein
MAIGFGVPPSGGLIMAKQGPPKGGTPNDWYVVVDAKESRI